MTAAELRISKEPRSLFPAYFVAGVAGKSCRQSVLLELGDEPGAGLVKPPVDNPPLDKPPVASPSCGVVFEDLEPRPVLWYAPVEELVPGVAPGLAPAVESPSAILRKSAMRVSTELWGVAGVAGAACGFG